MIYENKFLPFGRYRFSRRYSDSTIVTPQVFGITGHKAHGANGDDVDLFSLFGTIYDIAFIGKALALTGKTNPVRSSWRNTNIRWRRPGKLQGSGLALTYNQPLDEHVSIGAHTLFMHMRSRIDIVYMENPGANASAPTLAGMGDVDELYRTRLAVNNLLGITSEVSSQIGFGDLDLYVRCGRMWDYPRKFKRIDAGFSLGGIIATGVRRNIDNAASIPFGADGHSGIYIEGDAEFELKEDLKANVFSRVSKRFSLTGRRRASTDIFREPINYGALCGRFKVSPGFAWTIGLRVAYEDINKAFGASLQYLWTKKWSDTWTDKRGDQSIKFAKEFMEARSRFTIEYVTANIFYDFNKRVHTDETGPLVSLIWDIPTTQIAGRKVAASHRIAFGVEWDF